MAVLSPELFLAHAVADRAAAEELFDLLAPDVRPWLDTRSLLLGDEWPIETPRAQRAALATVILVSRNVDHAYYLRDEIHTAIALHRAFPDQHRAVAVFLDGRPTDPMQVPYGLRVLHGLDAVAEGGLTGVARKLRELVVGLRARGALTAPPAPSPLPAGPAAVDPQGLYERLCKLTLGAQIDAVILRAGLPREQIRPDVAPVAQRAIDIVLLATQGGPAVTARVVEAIAREAPWLTPLTQRPSMDRPGLPLHESRVSVLLVFANPRGTSPLRLGAEERALRGSIQMAKHRDRFDIEALHAATIDDLRRALIARQRTIVHISGHGTGDGLRFEDETGHMVVPGTGALGKLLQRRGVETVVLNACYSLAALGTDRMGTRYTVAMDGSVADAGAIEFSRGFYDVLGARGDVEEAYEEGLSCAELKGTSVKAVLLRT